MLYGLNNHSVSQPQMSFNSHSSVLNTSSYSILNKNNTKLLSCGVALIHMEKDYKYTALSNESHSYTFDGDNIGLAFVCSSPNALGEVIVSDEMFKAIIDLCYTHNVELTRWSKKEYGFYGGNYDHYESTEETAMPKVINGCVFMKPSKGIKAVWEGFNQFLVNYKTRQEYILEDTLNTLSEAKLKSEQKQRELSNILESLKG